MTVRISQLIETLQNLKSEHGDLPVKWQSLNHLWNVEELKVKTLGDGQTKIVLVNP